MVWRVPTLQVEPPLPPGPNRRRRQRVDLSAPAPLRSEGRSSSRSQREVFVDGLGGCDRPSTEAAASRPAVQLSARATEAALGSLPARWPAESRPAVGTQCFEKQRAIIVVVSGVVLWATVGCLSSRRERSSQRHHRMKRVQSCGGRSARLVRPACRARRGGRTPLRPPARRCASP